MAKYDEEGRIRIIIHVTLGVRRLKMEQAGVKEGECHLKRVSEGYKDVIWLEPIVCTFEYMPSDKNGYSQPVFEEFWEDKQPKEC